MDQNIVDIETLKRAIIERNEQNHIDLITNKMAFVSDLSIGKFPNVNRVNMWAFVLCTSGSCRFTLSHSEYEMHRGSMLVYRPNQKFKIEQFSDNCTGKILFVTDDVVDESLSKISDMFNFMIYVKENPFVQLTDNQCIMFEKYGQLVLLKAGDVGNLFYREVSTNRMKVLFFEVFNVYSQNLLRRNVLKTNKDFVLERFLQIVSKHYAEERSIKYYAGMMGLSPKYLSQICYQVSGKHAGEWIDRFVVSHAKELLSGTDLTIQQISNELHFPNQSFFGKYFRKHVGQSPREYRRNRNFELGIRS